MSQSIQSTQSDWPCAALYRCFYWQPLPGVPEYLPAALVISPAPASIERFAPFVLHPIGLEQLKRMMSKTAASGVWGIFAEEGEYLRYQLEKQVPLAELKPLFSRTQSTPMRPAQGAGLKHTINTILHSVTAFAKADVWEEAAQQVRLFAPTSKFIHTIKAASKDRHLLGQFDYRKTLGGHDLVFDYGAPACAIQFSGLPNHANAAKQAQDALGNKALELVILRDHYEGDALKTIICIAEPDEQALAEEQGKAAREMLDYARFIGDEKKLDVRILKPEDAVALL